MSNWYKIDDNAVSLDGDDVEIHVQSDDNGANYVVVSLKRILELANLTKYENIKE